MADRVGSLAAFEALHSIYSGCFYRTILSIARHPHDAEEALQDTFSPRLFGDEDI